METYKLEIFSNEDIELIESLEGREFAQELIENEIELIYQYLTSQGLIFEQISDNVFSIEINSFKDRKNEEIITTINSDIEMILAQGDIASFEMENYEDA